MPRPTIPDRADTLLDHARDAVLEHGYRDASIADIAARAGVGKGAVYLDFPSKRAMLDALLARSMRGLSRTVRDKVAAAETPVGVSSAFRFGLEALLEDRIVLAAYLRDENVLGGYIAESDPGRYRARMDWLTDYVVDLRAAGLVRPDLEPAAAVRLLSTFSVGLANLASAVGGLSAAQVGETVELMADLIAEGWEAPARTDAGARSTGGAEAARRAHHALLDRLDQQIGAA